MGDIKNLTGKYMGKMLESENKDKEGKDYKKYKLTFQIDDKQLNFKAFTPWTKKDGTPKIGHSPSNLEEGNWYQLGYTEYNGITPEGKAYVSKTIVSIKESTEPTEKQLNNTQPKTSPVTQQQTVTKTVGGVVLPTDAEINSILIQYKENVKPEAKSENHFIGTLIRSFNTNNEGIDKLIKIYKEKIL